MRNQDQGASESAALAIGHPGGDLIERLCRSLAFHLVESEMTFEHAEGEDLSYWSEEIAAAKALIKEAGFDMDVLYPLVDRPSLIPPQ